MNSYANVDIKIKGTHEEIIEAALYLKNHYQVEDFKVADSKEKLFAYIDHSLHLASEENMRELIVKLTQIIPNVSLNAVGIWENEETNEYQDFFYKYKNQELYFQTSDVYGKQANKEMTYEEFLKDFDLNESSISKEEFEELVDNDLYMSASAEYME